jgi:hypothetical protein
VQARCFAAFPSWESSASQDLTDLPAILTLSKSNWHLFTKIKQVLVQGRCVCRISLSESSVSQDLTDLPAMLTLSKSSWRLFNEN